MKAIDMVPIQRKYHGYFVALRERGHKVKVVGKGHTIGEALEEARKNGEDHPFVTRIPEENYSYLL